MSSENIGINTCAITKSRICLCLRKCNVHFVIKRLIEWLPYQPLLVLQGILVKLKTRNILFLAY